MSRRRSARVHVGAIRRDEPYEDGVCQLLRRQDDALMALIDVAAEPKILDLLEASGERYRSLFEHDRGGRELANVAPHLLCLSSNSPLLEPLVKRGWGRGWLTFLTTREEFEPLRAHLRSLLFIQHEDGNELYFRYYDPRVLRKYLSTCGIEKAEHLFGPVERFWFEGRLGSTLIRAQLDPRGATFETIDLLTPTQVEP